ncbi:hypothetical protein [Thermaurantiacus sp.]
MSLAAFQRALADLAASPELVSAVRRNPEAALRAYDLDERERRRLIHVAGQTGMEAQCTLYRVTRLASLTALLPETMQSLQPELRPIVDAYWKAEAVHDVRFAAEARRFLGFLEQNPHLLAKASGKSPSAVLSRARRELAANLRARV